MIRTSLTKEAVWALIEEVGIVPAIRVAKADDALFGAAAIFRGGIRIIELTMTVPGALGALSPLPGLSPGSGLAAPAPRHWAASNHPVAWNRAS